MATNFYSISVEFSPIFHYLGIDMNNTLLSLTHEQQQQAVEQIQQLMQQGISSGEAIALVAQQLKEKYHREYHQTIIPKENKEYE